MINIIMFDTKESEQVFLDKLMFSDFKITFFKEKLDETTKLTVKEYDETSILSIFITSKINGKVLDKFKNLRIIVTRSVCYSHIDIEECRKRNIAVINAENYGAVSVSQYVAGLIFILTRKIFLSANNIKEEKNIFENYQGNNIDKYSIGVIGTGSIGQEVCKIAHLLGMKIFAYDIKINESIKDFVEYVTFTDLLRKSDIVTLHIPYISECKHMFSFQEFEIMKNGSFFINTSQGDFINYSALHKALVNSKISGAALDIIWEDCNYNFDEPNKKPNYEELEKLFICQKIMKMNNVIITPRIAYNTTESLNNILVSNFNNIRNYFKGIKTNRIV